MTISCQLACDSDALPFRADSQINAAIRNEGARIPDKSLIPCDAQAALASANVSGICGQETFFEHVHFDFDGRYRLGRLWAEKIAPLLPPSTNVWLSQPECEQELGLSAWNKAQVIHFIDERMQVPPLSGQTNNQRRREASPAAGLRHYSHCFRTHRKPFVPTGELLAKRKAHRNVSGEAL